MPRFRGPWLAGETPGGDLAQPLSVDDFDYVHGTDDLGAPVTGPPVAAAVRAWERLAPACPAETVWRVVPEGGYA